MLRRAVLMAVLGLFILSSDAFAIKRTSIRMSFFELSGSASRAVGDYNQVVGLDFDFDNELVTFDADEVYRNGFAIGMKFGRMFQEHWTGTLGFNFYDHKLQNPMVHFENDIIYSIEFPQPVHVRSYELTLGVGWVPMNLRLSTFSPYLGVEVGAAFTGAEFENLETEYEISTVLRANAGIDLKLLKTRSGGFVTLSSLNSYDLLASDNRPQGLQLGLGIRYFFRGW